MSESTKYDRIFLQVCDDDESEWDGEVTWCQDRIHYEDVEYIRADLVEQQLADEFERGRKQGLADYYDASKAREEAYLAEVVKLSGELAAKESQITELKDWNSELVKHQDNLADRCDDLKEQLAAKDAEIATEQRLSFRNQVADLEKQIVMLRDASQAVIDRWDTPLWKDVPATAEYIGRLRNAVAAIDKELK